MFGTSTTISLTSFIKGGKISKTEAKNSNNKKIKTINSAIDLGLLRIIFVLFVKLQIMFAITKEQIISRKKSLRLQKIIKQMLMTNILKNKELFNFS